MSFSFHYITHLFLIVTEHHISMENSVKVIEFILEGLNSVSELQVSVSVIFIVIYLSTFSSVTSFWWTLAASPQSLPKKWLVLRGDKVISYDIYAAQQFTAAIFSTAESYLLASMAYDICAAVCKLLQNNHHHDRCEGVLSGYRTLWLWIL